MGFATVRTNPDVPKHDGITMMAIDMHAEGVEVRPLKQTSGASDFNEVFFNDVFVPDDDVVGPVDGGWTVARATLGNESVSIGGGSGGMSMPGAALVAPFDAHPERLHGGAARLGRYIAEHQSMGLLNLRSANRAVAGGEPGPEGAMTKLVLSEIGHEAAAIMTELNGPDSLFMDGPGGMSNLLVLMHRGMSIAGGTSEIKRNQIGERILGLPRDPLLKVVGTEVGPACAQHCVAARRSAYADRRMTVVNGERADRGRSAEAGRAERPSLGQVIRRSIATVLVVTGALIVSSWLISGFAIDTFGHALLAGVVIGLVDAPVWPAFAFLLVPLSVYTLGLANFAVNALVMWAVLDEIPGVRLDGFGTALLVALITTTVATLLSSALALDDDSWYDQRTARRRRRKSGTTISDVPGVVFVQVDGLSEHALRFALESGDAPTLHRWLNDGSHRRVGWQTEWSSQTGVSQCGILHGSTIDMPAFRWVEKSTGETMVSNHPKSAQEIERRHSDGNGLLANNGSSYANLFTGDASGRAHDERRRAAQGEQARRGLRPVLLPPVECHPDAELHHRRAVPRATGSA